MKKKKNQKIHRDRKKKNLYAGRFPKATIDEPS